LPLVVDWLGRGKNKQNFLKEKEKRLARKEKPIDGLEKRGIEMEEGRPVQQERVKAWDSKRNSTISPEAKRIKGGTGEIHEESLRGERGKRKNVMSQISKVGLLKGGHRARKCGRGPVLRGR